MLMSLTMLMAAAFLQTSDQAKTAKPAEAKPAPLNAFADRPNARILVTNQVRNFVVRQEQGYDQVVYLETTRNTWFRGDMMCRGIGDPRDAHMVQPIGHMNGIDANSTLLFRSFSAEVAECTLVTLVSLTPEEALDLKLIRPPKAKKG